MSLKTSEETAPATVRGPITSRQALFASTSGPQMLRGPNVAHAPEAETAAPADTGPLAMDDAISLLTAEEDALEGEPEAEAETEDDEDEAGDQPDDEDDAPAEEDEASEELDEDEEAEPELPAIDAPKFWSAEEKALFAKAPPEVQQLVAAKDAEAEKRVYAAKEAEAAARKDASMIAEVREAIDQHLARAETIFQGKWDGIDWAQWAKDDVAEYAAAKEEYEAEQRELNKLRTAHAATAEEEHRQFVKAEGLKLAEVVPELVDPVEGRNRKAALISMLTDAGFSGEDLKWAGAKELQIAWDAYQWRQAKANLAKAPPKLKTEPAKTAKPAGPVRPAAAAPPRKAIAQRRKAEVVSRAMKSGKMDDAVAAMLALEGS